MDDRELVNETQEAFYAAVEAGDLDALRDLWSTDPPGVCVHPGAAPIHGTANVLRSWALVMANTDYIQFFLTEVEISVRGDHAAVTCRENILTGAGAELPGGFAGGSSNALNVFVKQDGHWRLWVHQASPVGSEAE